MNRSSRNKLINIGILLLLGIFISFRINVACNQLDYKPSDETSSPSSSSDLIIPSDYKAVLPCATCPGIEYRLSLAENNFLEVNVYLNSNDEPVEIEGSWEIQSDNLFLINDDELIHKRFLIDQQTLILLDNDGYQIASIYPAEYSQY